MFGIFSSSFFSSFFFFFFFLGGGGGGGGGCSVCVFWFLGGVFFRGREGVWALGCFLGEGGCVLFLFFCFFSFCNTCNLNRGINK